MTESQNRASDDVTAASAMNLAQLLEQCVGRRRGAGDVELELRLGQRADTFHPGVSRVVFEQLERDLSEAPELSAEIGYTEIADYFYTLSSGRQIRTRVRYDSSSMELTTEHVEKRLLQSFVASASGDPGDTCRVEVSSEVPVESPPPSTLINFVRIKQRRAFVDRRGGGVVWQYELSRTWSGSTRDAVEYRQHNSEPVYEVECELVDNDGAYLEARTDSAVAESLHLKMLMLMGYDDPATPLEISHTRCEGGGLRRRRVRA